MIPRIVIVGAGGHAGVVIRAAELLQGKGWISGLLDDFLKPGEIRWGYPILGATTDLFHLPHEHWAPYAFLAVGDNQWRKRFLGETATLNFQFPCIVHPTAVVDTREIGEGVFIGAGAYVGPGCTVGAFSIINNHASLDHGSCLGEFSHLCPGAHTGGCVNIGSNTTIGLGALVRDHRTVGSCCTIGMGSVVVCDVPDNSFGFGNPWKSQVTL